MYFDGLFASEAAERLHLPVQAVREHCLNALRHLSASHCVLSRRSRLVRVAHGEGRDRTSGNSSGSDGVR